MIRGPTASHRLLTTPFARSLVQRQPFILTEGMVSGSGLHSIIGAWPNHPWRFDDTGAGVNANRPVRICWAI